MKSSMQSDFISLRDAEKLVNKSRPTLVRLCQKVVDSGNAKKSGRAWLIDKSFLLQYYMHNEVQSDEMQMKSIAHFYEKQIEEKDNVIRQLLAQLAQMGKNNEILASDNSRLIDENKRLQAPVAVESGRGISDWLIYVLVGAVLLLVGYAIFFQ